MHKDRMLVADPLLAFQAKSDFRVIAPAKTNLFLMCGQLRSDCYHQIDTVMHALSLHDILHVTYVDGPADYQLLLDKALAAQGGEGGEGSQGGEGGACTATQTSTVCQTAATSAQTNQTSVACQAAATQTNHDGKIQIELSCHSHEGIDHLDIPNSQNLIYKAIRMLEQKLGHVRKKGQIVKIRLEKNIPYQAGLGGGSSNAAAALLAMAKIWNLDPNCQSIVQTAQEIGKDVSFFLQGACCVYSGAGDKFVRSVSPAKLPILLVKPQTGISTAKAYAAIDKLRQEGGSAYLADDTRLQHLAHVKDVVDLEMFNSFSAVATQLNQDVAKVHSWMLEQDGIDSFMLCGSGSASFAICKSYDCASSLVAKAKIMGWWARATNLSSIRAAVVP